jgi:excisionase family DNA binding protein
MTQQLVKIGEAAELLGVSIDTLRRWDKSGKFKSIRTGDKGHRFYKFSDIQTKLKSPQNQKNLARQWVESQSGFLLDKEVFCQTRDVFQARLELLQSYLQKNFSLEITSLLTAITGEIGNNSFDHNLGHWDDFMGVFFHYDDKEKIVILADRGQGILSTLGNVRPDLKTSQEALQVAFTLAISGRKFEVRGNGLKFVRSVVVNGPFSLEFQTGNAFLHLNSDNKKVIIKEANSDIRGCFATIKIKE